MRGTVEFVKMNGAGNDFIMIKDLGEIMNTDPRLIASLCTSHRGIGADGLILIRPSSGADFTMRYYNSDGSEAQMCGNGARCAALFAFESGIAGRSMSFETDSGLVHAEILRDGISVDIGEAHDLRLGLDLEGLSVRIHFVVSGVPHAVILVDNAREYGTDDFLRMARYIRYNSMFEADGTNVNLVSVLGKNKLVYRTYERGIEDETLACGTGAIAAAVVTTHLRLTDTPVKCETSGGDFLEVEFKKTDTGAERCRLKGPAVESFRGTFRAEDYISR